MIIFWIILKQTGNSSLLFWFSSNFPILETQNLSIFQPFSQNYQLWLCIISSQATLMIFLAPSSTSCPASVSSLSPSSVPVPKFLFGWLINASVLLDFSMYWWWWCWIDWCFCFALYMIWWCWIVWYTQEALVLFPHMVSMMMFRLLLRRDVN